MYGFAAPEEPVELFALHVSALGRVSRPPGQKLPSASTSAEPAGTRRLVADDTTTTVVGAVYDRGGLLAGDELAGPSLILDPDATTYLPPN